VGWMDAPEVLDDPTPSWMGAPEQAPPQAVTPEPSMGEVALNAIPKGLANLLNTPEGLKHIMAKGLLYIPGAESIPGIKSAAEHPTNTPMDVATKMGLVDPAKNPQTGPQRIVDMAIQAAVGAAAIPAGGVAGALKGAAIGATSGAAAQTTKELTGSNLLAVAVGLVAPFAISAAGSGAKTMIGNATRKQTLQEAQAVGYVVEPSSVRQPTSKLETIAGKASIAQEASFRNQAVTNKLAAKAIGLPEDTPLSLSIIDEVRRRAAKPYEEIQQLAPGSQLQGLKVKTIEDRPMVPGPITGVATKEIRGEAPTTFGLKASEIRDEAGNLLGMHVGTSSKAAKGPLESVSTNVTSRGQDVPGALQGLKVQVREMRGEAILDQLRQARSDASTFYRHYDRSSDPASLAQGKKAAALAESLETQIEEIAQRAGRPELVDQLRAARQLYARTYDVERALNLGSGNVSAPILGRMVDQGRPLSGELRVIGKFAQAFPRVAREVEGVPPAGVSGTDAASSAVLGIGGAAAAGNPLGAVAGGLPLLRGPARTRVLSEGYQSKLLEPSAPPTPSSVTAGRAAMVGKTQVEEGAGAQ
jgi:hypothetical protein